MDVVISSTKDFSVGDLFIKDDLDVCYITRIYQEKKGAQYQYFVHYFHNSGYQPKYYTSCSLKKKMCYWRWKHIPVVK